MLDILIRSPQLGYDVHRVRNRGDVGVRRQLPVRQDAKAIVLDFMNPAGAGMSRFLLNIEKRSLPRLMLSCDGMASKDGV